MMKTSLSLPSLGTTSRLFGSEVELESARSEFKARLQAENQRSQSEEKKSSRALIHFTPEGQGFLPFRSINTQKAQEILASLKGMRTGPSTIGKSVKAEILFNQREYGKITNYCQEKIISEKQKAIQRLAQLEPLPMKREVKMTQKSRKKIKTTVAIKLDINYTSLENNRLAWKPFVDFDAMPVVLGSKIYYVGGRTNTHLSYYDHSEQKWGQTNAIQGLKTFGQSQGTIVSDEDVVFFGGSKFYVMGESEVTNCVTRVNMKTKSAKITSFPEETISGRCFHAQSLYGEYLIVSGGINRLNKLESNFMVYHLIKSYWFQLTLSKLHPKLVSGFAKHRMMPILRPRKNYHLYEQEHPLSSELNFAHQGIYIFGGEDVNTELSNKLYVLTVGRPSLEVYEPQTKGTPPDPRKNFAWTRIGELLLIHGGRNDEMKPWVLASLSVLNLKNMNWLSVKGERPSRRHSHALMTYSNEIVILGGKNIEGLCKQICPLIVEEVTEWI